MDPLTKAEKEVSMNRVRWVMLLVLLFLFALSLSTGMRVSFALAADDQGPCPCGSCYQWCPTSGPKGEWRAARCTYHLDCGVCDSLTYLCVQALDCYYCEPYQ